MSEDVEVAAPKVWKATRWQVVLGIFFAVVAMAVVGIAVAAQIAWQSSPEKMLLDALDYSTKTPAEYKVTSKDVVGTINYDGTRNAFNGTYKSVQLRAVFDGSNLYVKSATPAELVKLFVPQNLPSDAKPAINSITTLITNRWVSVPIDDVKFADTTASNNNTCVMLARSQFMTNEETPKELAKLYENNKFIIANKTASTDKSTTYKLAADVNSYNAFMTALIGSKFYNSLKSQCAQTVQKLKSLGSKGVTVDAQLSNAKHAVQTLAINGLETEPVKIAVTYGNVGTIQTPTDAISYNSLSNSVIQALISKYLGQNN